MLTTILPWGDWRWYRRCSIPTCRSSCLNRSFGSSLDRWQPWISLPFDGRSYSPSNCHILSINEDQSKGRHHSHKQLSQRHYSDLSAESSTMDCSGFHYWSKRTKRVYPSFCSPTAEERKICQNKSESERERKSNRLISSSRTKKCKNVLGTNQRRQRIIFCLSPFSDRRLDCSNRDWIRQTALANNNNNSGTFSRRGYFKCRYHWASCSRDLRMFPDNVNGFHCINTSRNLKVNVSAFYQRQRDTRLSGFIVNIEMRSIVLVRSNKYYFFVRLESFSICLLID